MIPSSLTYPFGIQIADSILLLDFCDYVITVLAWPESGKFLSHCRRVLDQIVHISIQSSFKNKNADTAMKVRIFKTGLKNPYVTLGQTIRMLHWAKQSVCYTGGRNFHTNNTLRVSTV